MDSTYVPTGGASTPRELTFGEKAVGLTFNPSGDENVNAIKSLYGQVIDHLNNMRAAETNHEKNRMLSIAITETQTAQMWAVKAITWKD